MVLVKVRFCCQPYKTAFWDKLNNGVCIHDLLKSPLRSSVEADWFKLIKLALNKFDLTNKSFRPTLLNPDNACHVRQRSAAWLQKSN